MIHVVDLQQESVTHKGQSKEIVDQGDLLNLISSTEEPHAGDSLTEQPYAEDLPTMKPLTEGPKAADTSINETIAADEPEEEFTPDQIDQKQGETNMKRQDYT